MSASILRGGSIAQFLSVLLFVFVTTHFVPVCLDPEAAAIAPVIEQGMSHDEGIVAPDVLLHAEPLFFTPDLCADLVLVETSVDAVPTARITQRSILRL